MKTDIQFHRIINFRGTNGFYIENLEISYQIFGRALHTAPLVLVNHALTGNSDLASETKGWWKSIIGENKLLDTTKYTIIGINIPGNGYHNQHIENYKALRAQDIAKLFIQTLKEIGIKELFAVMGGSLGGGIAWEMAALAPNFIRYLIPIAADWKSTDWIIGHNYIQENILNSSPNPMQTARMMAMLFYRTPASLETKFHRSKMENNSQFQIESWLQYHGDKLNTRFELLAYKTMTHLLTTVDITKGKAGFEEAVKPIQSTIIQIAIDSDLFFVKEENLKTKALLDNLKIKNQYFEINSIHGHDAFLIEFEQLSKILKPYFD
ncbi:MAG: alpha/beta fold hydrolase [Bacteroidales bacterium]|nr:alpha/beta fold hydrolase [Bacteroidales bacterium]